MYVIMNYECTPQKAFSNKSNMSRDSLRNTGNGETEVEKSRGRRNAWQKAFNTNYFLFVRCIPAPPHLQIVSRQLDSSQVY